MHIHIHTPLCDKRPITDTHKRDLQMKRDLYMKRDLHIYIYIYIHPCVQRSLQQTPNPIKQTWDKNTIVFLTQAYP